MQFNLQNTQAISTNLPKLKGWEIHEVTLKKVEYKEIEGKKDPSQKYQMINIRFENPTGFYEESLFAPKETDVTRKATTDGREMVSNFENFQFTIAHLAQTLSPTAFEKLKGLTFDFSTPEGFKKFAEAFVTVMSPAVGKITNLKLITNKKGEVRLPYFVALNKEGVAFIASNFVGPATSLFFSSYEEATRLKQANAKPTTMEDKGKSSSINNDLDEFEL